MISLGTSLIVAAMVSVDVFFVCLSIGAVLTHRPHREIIRVSALFGSAATIMLGVGWMFADSVLTDHLTNYRWTAGVVLILMGLNVVRKTEVAAETKDAASVLSVSHSGFVFLSSMTAVDAGAVGGAFAVNSVGVEVLLPVLFVSSFMIAVSGLTIGSKLRECSPRLANRIGGLAFVLIGLAAIVL
jgi:putative Mn2+ efflux pump MntP